MVYRWDELEEHLTPHFSEMARKEEKYLLSVVRADWDVLEIGCGTGRLLTKLARHVSRIEGIEHEYDQIKIARERTRDLPNVRVRYSDGRSLPEELYENFDLTFSTFNMLGNQGHDKFVFLKEAKKATKPDGTIVLSVYSEHALECQLEAYRQFGYETKVQGDYVFAKNRRGSSWMSERFTQDKLKDLFHDNGFDEFYIERLTDIAYVCRLRKSA